MVDRWECDCAPPTVLTAHYLKAVRASDYDALAAELAAEKETRAMWQADCLEADARAKALEADRDQISLTLDVAKADRDKWFNRARDLEKALREAIPAFNTTRIIMNSQEARDEAGEMVTRWRAVLEGSALEAGDVKP